MKHAFGEGVLDAGVQPDRSEVTNTARSLSGLISTTWATWWVTMTVVPPAAKILAKKSSQNCRL